MKYRIAVPPGVAEHVRRLPPEIRRAIREAMHAIAGKPALGEPLRLELSGHFKYRVRRYRILYQVDRARRVVRIMAVGHRRTVYEDMASVLRGRREA